MKIKEEAQLIRILKKHMIISILKSEKYILIEKVCRFLIETTPEFKDKTETEVAKYYFDLLLDALDEVKNHCITEQIRLGLINPPKIEIDLSENLASPE